MTNAVLNPKQADTKSGDSTPRALGLFTRWFMVPPYLWKHVNEGNYDDFSPGALEHMWNTFYPWIIYLCGVATGIFLILEKLS